MTVVSVYYFVFFKQKTAYEMRISDWSSDVCSSDLEALPDDEASLPQAQIRRGTGRTINNAVAASPPPNLAGTTGETTFNFEGESLQAVVKAILGDMLGQNYVIEPGVQGTVTLATPKPVSPAQALSLLEMVLGWNNARMIYSDGRSEEYTSELQSLMRISYAVFCLKKKNNTINTK